MKKMIFIYKNMLNKNKIDRISKNILIISEGYYQDEQKVFSERNEDDEFVVHGYYTVSNSGGYEVQLNNSGDGARLRTFSDGQPQVSEWFEIETVPNEDYDPMEDDENDEYISVIDPGGYNVPLNMVMRTNR